MALYNLVLFLHLITIGGAFFALGIMLSSIARLRATRSIVAARAAAATAAGTGKIMPVATLLFLATGAYLTSARWTWSTPWIDVSIAGLLVVTAFGGGVMGTRERAVHRALETADGTALDAQTARRVVDPFLVVGSAANIGLVCGVMFVMVVKPSLAGGVLALVVAAACGAFAGSAAIRPHDALRARAPERAEA